MRTMVLNSLGLAISKATADGDAVEAKVDDAAQFLTLTAPRELASGKHRVRIEFTGKLSEAPQGIYLSRYQHPNGAWASRGGALDGNEVYATACGLFFLGSPK